MYAIRADVRLVKRPMLKDLEVDFWPLGFLKEKVGYLLRKLLLRLQNITDLGKNTL